MPNMRLGFTDVKGVDLVLNNSIGIGDAVMLAEMFKPTRNGECLDDAARI